MTGGLFALQVTARMAGVNDADAKSDAALAVQSIPAYVEASDLFIALVPPLTHVDTGRRVGFVCYVDLFVEREE